MFKKNRKIKEEDVEPTGNVEPTEKFVYGGGATPVPRRTINFGDAIDVSWGSSYGSSAPHATLPPPQHTVAPASRYDQLQDSPWMPVTVSGCLEMCVIEEIAQYPDGVFGNCVNCTSRIKIPTVPGGYTAMQVRGFLERVIAGDESVDDGELLVELGKLLAVMALEEEELLLAKDRVRIAETLLKQRAAA